MQPNGLPMEANDFREHPDGIETQGDASGYHPDGLGRQANGLRINLHGAGIDPGGLAGRGNAVGPLAKAVSLTAGPVAGHITPGGWEWPSGRLAAGRDNGSAQSGIIMFKLMYYTKCIRIL